MNIKSLSNKHFSYQNRLLNLHDPPVRLLVSGDLSIDRPLLAVVGSRRATAYSQQVINELLPPLIRAGVGIISGLAFGVDSLAHKEALRSRGYTIAVLPSGLPDVYPKNHLGLSQEILKSNGALVSEHKAPHNVMKQDFLARNRIVAALADAVLVVEATERSGTSSTVRHSLDLGIPVLAVPGPITSSLSKGTNQLLKLGAEAVTEAEDIAYILGIDLQNGREVWGEDDQEQVVIESLIDEPRSIDELSNLVQLSVSDLTQILTKLELRGIVRALGAQKYSLMG